MRSLDQSERGEKDMSKIAVEVHKGQRVKVKTPDGIKEGTVKEVDPEAFPFGKVIIETDDGETIEKLIEIGGI
jgi:hypothetical protein